MHGQITLADKFCNMLNVRTNNEVAHQYEFIQALRATFKTYKHVITAAGPVCELDQFRDLTDTPDATGGAVAIFRDYTAVFIIETTEGVGLSTAELRELEPEDLAAFVATLLEIMGMEEQAKMLSERFAESVGEIMADRERARALAEAAMAHAKHERKH